MVRLETEGNFHAAVDIRNVKFYSFHIFHYSKQGSPLDLERKSVKKRRLPMQTLASFFPDDIYPRVISMKAEKKREIGKVALTKFKVQ